MVNRYACVYVKIYMSKCICVSTHFYDLIFYDFRAFWPLINQRKNGNYEMRNKSRYLEKHSQTNSHKNEGN